MGAKYLLVLFFFIIYDLIVTFILLWNYLKYKTEVEKKDNYIEKLYHLIANFRKK